MPKIEEVMDNDKTEELVEPAEELTEVTEPVEDILIVEEESVEETESIADPVIEPTVSDERTIPEDDIERRYIPIDAKFETREDETGELITMVGYSAKFGTFFEDTWWGVRETIAPGAFTNPLGKSDVRALWNHDSSMPLARSTISSGAGSLVLREDETGLYSEITPTNTSYARDLKVNVESGVVSQQSFAFTVKREMWEEDSEKDIVTRTILEIEELFDVSPVTYPAYKDTDVAIKSSKDYKKLFRSLDNWKEERKRSADEKSAEILEPELIEQEPVDQKNQRDESARVASRERIRQFKHARRNFNYKNRKF